MSDPIPCIVQGLGPIGQRILMAAHSDAQLDVVAAVDVDKRLLGRPLDEVVPGAPDHLTVRASVGLARADAGVDEAVVLQATTPYLDAAIPQVEEALALGLHVVSTCEELAYPFSRDPEASARLNELARAAERTVVATGVNPGFLMDQLPVVLRAASHSIRAIHVRRVQNPRLRRLPFQEKVGMNITRQEYERRLDSGHFGHVGLEESGQMIAIGLNWQIDDWEHEMRPVQPDPDGLVLGTLETLSGATADGRQISLHFEAQSGVDPPYDEIIVDGVPPPPPALRRRCPRRRGDGRLRPALRPRHPQRPSRPPDRARPPSPLSAR